MVRSAAPQTFKSLLLLMLLLAGFGPKNADAAGLLKTAALSIQTRTIPAGVVGQPYSSTLQAVGGTPSYTWLLPPGLFTNGLSLSRSGVLSGTPLQPGTFSVVALVQDAGRPSISTVQTLQLKVTVQPLVLNAGTPAAGAVGQSYAFQMNASGGMQQYAWSLTSGNLPAGLTMSSTTGLISGKPTAAGTYNFGVSLKDGSAPAQLQTAAVTISVTAPPPPFTTWYVRPDGGNRYSTNVPNGQCDGLGDAPYPGKGVNQHCAFNDVRLLWQDGSFAYEPSSGLSSFPAAGWIGKGGDTYIIRGSIGSGAAPYRIGWDNWDVSACSPANQAKYGNACHRGWVGDPFSTAPTPPAGTASLHTRILGENWQACHAQSARTPIVGHWNVYSVFKITSSYVDMQCLDLSDASNCVVSCQGTDSAGQGLQIANTADHLTLTDLRIHGFSNFGIFGPSGDGSVFSYIGIFGNGGGGWSADANDGKTGTGTLLVQHYEISWNGCAEEYPIVDAVPYTSCRDQSHGGYGDGFGTATVASNPGWQAHFDQGTVAYNTQDGLDALHLIGNGSTMTVTRTLAYGNMGQQVKIGGAAGTLQDSLIVGNCTAMSNPIPGTPANYNANLGDFCRAGNDPVAMTVGHGSTTYIQHNTIEGNGALLISYICDGSNGNCDSTALVDLRNNILLGNPDYYRGAPGGNYLMVVDNTYTTPAACNAVNDGQHGWITDGVIGCGNNVFYNRGSYNSNNVYFQLKDSCTDNNGTNNLCMDPGLVSEIVPTIGYPNLSLSGQGGAAFQAGVSLPYLTSDYSGHSFHASPSIGALEQATPVSLYLSTQ